MTDTAKNLIHKSKMFSNKSSTFAEDFCARDFLTRQDFLTEDFFNIKDLIKQRQ